MAGLGRKVWSAGEVMTAVNVQGYLQDQVVQVYASSAARSSALGTAVSQGMITTRTDVNTVELYDGVSWVNPKLTNVMERVYTTATGFAGYTFDASTNGSVQYITANATANGTVNIRSSSTQTLNALMAVNDSMTIVLAITNGATAYYPTAYQIDGAAVTPKWSGGTAPTGGNASAIDVYTFTIIKTASATFTVLAAQVKFA